MSIGAYVLKVLIAIDMLGSVIVFGVADITISAQTGIALRAPTPPLWARVLGGALNGTARLFGRGNHCEQAITDDATRAIAALKALRVLRVVK